MTKNNVTNTNNESEFSILIVEDEYYNYLYLHEVLNSFNVNLIRAANGKEAVDLCNEKDDIRLVLMDIRMPVMDGYEATRHIKQTKPQLAVIAQTAYSMEADRERILREGFDDYLPKPIRKQDILDSVSKNLPEGFILAKGEKSKPIPTT